MAVSSSSASSSTSAQAYDTSMAVRSIKPTGLSIRSALANESREQYTTAAACSSACGMRGCPASATAAALAPSRPSAVLPRRAVAGPHAARAAERATRAAARSPHRPAEPPQPRCLLRAPPQEARAPPPTPRQRPSRARAPAGLARGASRRPRGTSGRRGRRRVDTAAAAGRATETAPTRPSLRQLPPPARH
eukprot:scaffold1640_cov111-Isochrysis_galbana.AAC.22